MVSEHLQVILATFLYIDDDDLLDPKSQLGQHVSLHDTRDFPDRPVGPQILHV